MAANTSKYMYIVGTQFFEGSTMAEPWSVLLLTESLPDAKAFVQRYLGPDASIINADVKRNDYWYTVRLRPPGEGDLDFMLDIQRVKVAPVVIAPEKRERGPKGSARGAVRGTGGDGAGERAPEVSDDRSGGSPDHPAGGVAV